MQDAIKIVLFVEKGNINAALLKTIDNSTSWSYILMQ